MSDDKVVLEEPVETKEEKQVDTSDLTEAEIKSAKEFGIVKDDPEKKEEPKEEPKEEKEAKPIDPSTFEEMDEAYKKDDGKFHKDFSSNAKALYFKFKRNKQMRQEAQDLADKVTKERDFLTTKEKAYVKKLSDVVEILDKIDAGETLTTADIRKIVAHREEVKEAEAKEEAKQEVKTDGYLQEKAKNTQMLGMSKYEDFERIVDLANEVVAKDKDVALLITRAYKDQEVDEEQLLEKIVKVARMHEDFGKKPEEKSDKSEKVEKKDIDRMVANAQKKKTSASLTSGKGRREVSYEELTLADIANMDQDQYNKIPAPIRERLMRESSK